MSEDQTVNTEPTEPTGPQKANVLPRTLGIRPLRLSPEIALAGVYGGNAGNVWVATFADEAEAQAWIMASNAFGQPVNGYISPNLPKIAVEYDTPVRSVAGVVSGIINTELTDGAGVSGREQADEAN